MDQLQAQPDLSGVNCTGQEACITADTCRLRSLLLIVDGQMLVMQSFTSASTVVHMSRYILWLSYRAKAGIFASQQALALTLALSRHQFAVSSCERRAKFALGRLCRGQCANSVQPAIDPLVGEPTDQDLASDRETHNGLR